ncbi:unnamed protein product, partial [Prorocentrum cordatum]
QKLRLRPLICDATEVSTAAGPRLANTLVDTECATKPLGLHPRATQIEDVVVRHSPGPFACHGGGGGSLSQDGDWWREGPPPQDREPAGGLGKSSLEETGAGGRKLREPARARPSWPEPAMRAGSSAAPTGSTRPRSSGCLGFSCVLWGFLASGCSPAAAPRRGLSRGAQIVPNGRRRPKPTQA